MRNITSSLAPFELYTNINAFQKNALSTDKCSSVYFVQYILSYGYLKVSARI